MSDALLARVEALESKVTALEEKGPPVHTRRLDGLDERVDSMQREFRIWRDAIASDISSQLELARTNKVDMERLYMLMERLLDSHRLVAGHLKLGVVSG